MSSSGSRPTNETQPFLPEWVTEVFYGGQWHQVRLGSFKGIKMGKGVRFTYTYLDPYSEDSVWVAAEIQGYKFRKPQETPNVVQLHQD